VSVSTLRVRLAPTLSYSEQCRLAFFAALVATLLPLNITRVVVANGYATEANPGANAIIQASGFYGAAIVGLGTTLLLFAVLRYTIGILPRFSLSVAYAWVGVSTVDTLLNLHGLWLLGELPIGDAVGAMAFFVYSVVVTVFCILAYDATAAVLEELRE